jgi:hypothetical protein
VKLSPARLKILREMVGPGPEEFRELLAHVEEQARAVNRLLRFWGAVEERSADAHGVYQQEAHQRGDVRHPDAYADLSEATKEWDRVLVRWVLSATREQLHSNDGEESA